MISKGKYKGERITLRPFETNDAENFYESVKESVPQLRPWFQWCHDGYTQEDVEKFIASRLISWERGDEYDFLIEDVNSHKLIGAIGLNRIDKKNGAANIGYWIRSSATKKGYATAALKLAASWAFRQLELNRVEALCVVENVSSIRVAEKASFVREGVLRKRILLHGFLHDAVMLALLREGIT